MMSVLMRLHLRRNQWGYFRVICNKAHCSSVRDNVKWSKMVNMWPWAKMELCWSCRLFARPNNGPGVTSEGPRHLPLPQPPSEKLHGNHEVDNNESLHTIFFHNKNIDKMDEVSPLMMKLEKTINHQHLRLLWYNYWHGCFTSFDGKNQFVVWCFWHHTLSNWLA